MRFKQYFVFPLAVLAFVGTTGFYTTAHSEDMDHGHSSEGKHHAHPMKHRQDKFPEMEKRRQEMFERLGLSDEQKLEMNARHKQFKMDNKAELDEVKTLHDQLTALRGQPEKAKERMSIHQELKVKHEALMEKKNKSIAGILTPEQQVKFEAFREETRQKMEKKGHLHKHNKMKKTADY
ncbi:MAG: Spy/CpxP family protein refolding chaperone [Cyanobacteria bacterium P01_H01_bin.74]